GRSKTVTVEVRKTRTFAQGAGGMVEVKPQGGAAFNQAAVDALADDEATRHLSTAEKQARLNALKIAEEEMKKATEQRASQRREETKRKPEREAEESYASPSGIVTPQVKAQPETPAEAGRPAKAAATAAPSAKPSSKTHHVMPDEEAERADKNNK